MSYDLPHQSPTQPFFADHKNPITGTTMHRIKLGSLQIFESFYFCLTNLIRHNNLYLTSNSNSVSNINHVFTRFNFTSKYSDEFSAIYRTAFFIPHRILAQITE